MYVMVDHGEGGWWLVAGFCGSGGEESSRVKSVSHLGMFLRAELFSTQRRIVLKTAVGTDRVDVERERTAMATLFIKHLIVLNNPIAVSSFFCNNNVGSYQR